MYTIFCISTRTTCFLHTQDILCMSMRPTCLLLRTYQILCILTTYMRHFILIPRRPFRRHIYTILCISTRPTCLLYIYEILCMSMRRPCLLLHTLHTLYVCQRDTRHILFCFSKADPFEDKYTLSYVL